MFSFRFCIKFVLVVFLYLFSVASSSSEPFQFYSDEEVREFLMEEAILNVLNDNYVTIGQQSNKWSDYFLAHFSTIIFGILILTSFFMSCFVFYKYIMEMDKRNKRKIVHYLPQIVTKKEKRNFDLETGKRFIIEKA